MKRNSIKFMSLVGAALLLASCSKNDDKKADLPTNTKITIENVLDAKTVVQSGSFKNEGSSPVIMPGESITIQFYAGQGQTITFATMYGWSNDLFFAPANPGIKVYQDNGTPIEGDVSAQIKLWDNGTRINQAPGQAITHPGVAETTAMNVTEVNGTDAQGNTYAAAKDLLNASLKYDGDSKFTLTIKNTSGNTSNPTPFSPGVWAISYVEAGEVINKNIFYESGKPTANGLTNLAEAGDYSKLETYVKNNTGVLTGFSPVLVVVYNGIENPLYKVNEKDRGKGLKNIAQMGDATALVSYLKTVSGVKDVYVLNADKTKILVPRIGDQAGSKVSQTLRVIKGDRVAIATMYGLSNDWFFASKDNGVDATQKGDVSNTIGLFDNGTAIDGFPGANNTLAALGGTPVADDVVIKEVALANSYITLPAVKDFIKVTLE